MNPRAFRELVSGQRRGMAAAASRGGLRLLEIPYRLATAVRGWAYDVGLRSVHRVGVPVISVGNLTAGGTGKSPLVRWLAEWFLQRGQRVGVISRGYKAVGPGANDEARELAHWMPQTVHLQNPDRVAAARLAIRDHQCAVLVLDDAFQHRRIHRDLDIVLLDALQPFGFEHLLPRGLLREPAAALRRAHIVGLSRTDCVGDPERQTLRERVQRLAPHAGWVELVHRPLYLLSPTGERRGLEHLRGARVAAFCGIGNPAGFWHTLESCGASLAGVREFPDHHAYSAADAEELAAWGKRLDGVTAVVCTLKDLVKLRADRVGPIPVWALAIGIQFRAGADLVEERLRALVSGESRRA